MSQDLSEFALHARAILGLPIPAIRQMGATASAVILVKGHSTKTAFASLAQALQEPDTALRLFGKPAVEGELLLPFRLALKQHPCAAHLQPQAYQTSVMRYLALVRPALNWQKRFLSNDP